MLFWECKRLSTGWAGHASFEEMFLFWEWTWMVLCLHTCSVLMDQCFVWREEYKKSVTGALKRQDIQIWSHFVQKQIALGFTTIAVLMVQLKQKQPRLWQKFEWINEWNYPLLLEFRKGNYKNKQVIYSHTCIFIHLHTSVCILSISILAYCFLLQTSLTGSTDDMHIPSKKEVIVRNKKNTWRLDLRTGCKGKVSCCLGLTI